jgi:tRNA-dihydrouridine synthase
MIGRGALGNPFLFTEMIAALENRPFTPPTVEEKLSVALEHARRLAKTKGERVGIAESRKHMAWYCKGIRGAATARDALMRANTLADVTAIFERMREEEL